MRSVHQESIFPGLDFTVPGFDFTKDNEFCLHWSHCYPINTLNSGYSELSHQNLRCWLSALCLLFSLPGMTSLLLLPQKPIGKLLPWWPSGPKAWSADHYKELTTHSATEYHSGVLCKLPSLMAGLPLFHF